MIRAATPDDAAAVAAIYAPYVSDTAISFEDEPPGTAEMAGRIERSLGWLVAEDEPGEVVGYAYAGPFHARPAYRYAAEVSIYLAASARGRGLGRALAGELLQHLRSRGIVQAFAGIALPNPASIGLFESLGFERAATYRAVGWKLGAWHDVGWWQLALVDPASVSPD